MLNYRYTKRIKLIARVFNGRGLLNEFRYTCLVCHRS